MTRLITLCGRGAGACAVAVEAGQLHCVTCDAIAPITARTAALISDTAASALGMSGMSNGADERQQHMTESHDDDAVRLIAAVSETSGLLDALRNELAFASGWPEIRDAAQIREALERAFHRDALTMPGLGLHCPDCGASVAGVRCGSCNRKLAVVEVELQHMAAREAQAQENTNA